MRCASCSKHLASSNFSNRQLAKAQSGKGGTCIDCTATSRTDLHCHGCKRMKPLDAFSKSVRRNGQDDKVRSHSVFVRELANHGRRIARTVRPRSFTKMRPGNGSQIRTTNPWPGPTVPRIAEYHPHPHRSLRLDLLPTTIRDSLDGSNSALAERPSQATATAPVYQCPVHSEALPAHLWQARR